MLGCSCRRSCLFLASLLVLLAARVSRVSAEHSALLFTLGNPTAAQRARVCRLVAEERAAASTAAVLDVHVLDYHPASSGSTLLDGMCGPGAPQPDTVSALTRAGLAAVFGPEFGDFYMRHAYRLPQTHYSWWWTAVGAARGYERVWVLEADGAPRGQGGGGLARTAGRRRAHSAAGG